MNKKIIGFGFLVLTLHGGATLASSKPSNKEIEKAVKEALT